MMLQETSKDGSPDGADVLFPCSVYALLQLKKYEVEGSNSTQLLKSNLAYVRHFRQESFLCGQDDYYLQTLESVIEFIQNLSETYKTDLLLKEGEDLPSELEEWSWSYEEPSSTEDAAASSNPAAISQTDTVKQDEAKKEFSIEDMLSSDTNTATSL